MNPSGIRTARFEALLTLLAIAIALVLVSSGAAAQSASTLTGFRSTHDYLLEIDGEVDRGAEIYFQQRLPGYLVLPSKLTTPLLLVPRSGVVRGVNIMKITKGSDGSLDLTPDALYKTFGQFRLEGTSIAFDIEGHELIFKEKPPLLGTKTGEDLKEYAASYGERAAAYEPDEEVLDKLRADSREIRVRVYFGSWCPFCQRYVPRMIKVADALGDAVAIDFYGLAHDFSSDPEPKRMNISSVPTGVVYVDGKEAGRIRSDDWRAPEKAIWNLANGK